MAQKVVVEGNKNYGEALEAGNILFFPSIPFPFPQEEIDFLLKQRQGGSRARKNIAYKPALDKITNHDATDPQAAHKLKEILRNYSRRATEYLSHLLPYAREWKLDFASFRPFQEKGRNLRLRARNDLLHVDAFPTRPLHGARILRFFTNINPTEARVWRTTKPFEELIVDFGGKGIPYPSAADRSWKIKLEKFLGLRSRSPYDQFMLRMHNFMKENSEFQRTTAKDSWEFPPHSCWAVFTDQVSHAALAGQYALEQTFIVPQSALLRPEKSPLAVLERMAGRKMV